MLSKFGGRLTELSLRSPAKEVPAMAVIRLSDAYVTVSRLGLSANAQSSTLVTVLGIVMELRKRDL